MNDVLKLDGVHTHIGHYHILHGVDFSVPEGKTTMLLGRNGAGKTTTHGTLLRRGTTRRYGRTAATIVRRRRHW